MYFKQTSRHNEILPENVNYWHRFADNQWEALNIYGERVPTERIVSDQSVLAWAKADIVLFVDSKNVKFEKRVKEYSWTEILVRPGTYKPYKHKKENEVRIVVNDSHKPFFLNHTLPVKSYGLDNASASAWHDVKFVEAKPVKIVFED